MTLADGNTVVSWCNAKNAGDSDIFALFLNANRAVEGAPVQLNLTADNQSKPNACPPLPVASSRCGNPSDRSSPF